MLQVWNFRLVTRLVRTKNTQVDKLKNTPRYRFYHNNWHFM